MTLDSTDLDYYPDDQSPHQGLIQAALPDWLISAPPALRERYFKSSRTSLYSNVQAMKVTGALQTPQAFCAPLLQAELDRRYPQLKLDVNKYELVRMVRDADPLYVRLNPVSQTLLEAALQNFDADEASPGGIEAGSVILPVGVFTYAINDDGTLRYIVDQAQVVDLAPHDFAALCRQLDLGKRYQAHVVEAFGIGSFKAPTRDLTPERKRMLLEFQLRDRLEVEAVTARIKGHLYEDAYRMVLQITQPQQAGEVPLWANRPVAFHQLRLLRTTFRSGLRLGGALLIAPLGNPGECLVYLPGEPDAPLKCYSSLQAFADQLREKLRSPAYQQYFLRFVPHRDAADFIRRLNNTLSPTPPTWPLQIQPSVPQRDPNADIGVRSDPYPITLTRLMFWHHVQMIQRNAKALVVPTSEQDRRARARRLAWWESAGLSVLNLAAFSVPGVGELMAVVGAVELVKDVCLGVDDWTHGQTAEAMEHFASVAQNVAMIGAGVVGGVALARSPFVEALVPVTDARGATRLVHPDLSAYASDVVLPEGLEPNAAGQYVVDGKHYVSLDGRLFEQQLDPASGQWTLQHPRLAADYQPLLHDNGAGAWQHVHERPLEWEGSSLMRRFGAVTDGLADHELVRLRQACGFSEAQLRQLQVNRQSMPPVLEEVLERVRAQRSVDALATGLREQLPLAEGADYALPLLARLPRWPEGLGLRVLGEDGSVRDFLPGRDGQRIELTRDDWRSGRLGERVVQQLRARHKAELFADNVGSTERAQAQALAEALAEQVGAVRDEIAGGLIARRQPTLDPAALPLQRDFPGLSNRVANDLLTLASDRDLARLLDGKVPLRLAEAARLQVRDLRLNTATAALMDAARTSPDRDLLALGLMEHLPGWDARTRIELVADYVGGPTLAAAGSGTAAEVKFVVRRDGLYQAFDAREQELSAQVDLFTAINRALPDSTRASLSLPSNGGEALRDGLLRLAVADRDRARLLLGQRLVEPWFRVPTVVNGVLGYELSGRGRLFGGNTARLQDLYPSLDNAALRRVLNAVRRPGESDSLAITRLETEFRVLDRSLNEWARQGSPAQVVARRTVRNRLLAAWRREGATLVLSGGEVGALPVITADFSHIDSLTLTGMGPQEDLSAFIAQFPLLGRLNLQDNVLTQIPAAIGQLAHLKILKLGKNNLAVSDTMFEALTVEEGFGSNLVQLELPDAFSVYPSFPEANPLSAAALATLRDLGSLRRLDLSSNTISLDDAAFAVLGQMDHLRELRLRGTRVELNAVRQASLARLDQLHTLDLSETRLGIPPDVTRMGRLQTLGLFDAGIAAWPPGLTELLMPPAGDTIGVVRVNLDQNAIVELPNFTAAQMEELSWEVELTLDGNPLSPRSRELLRNTDFIYIPPRGAPVDALVAAPPDLAARIAADRLQPAAEAFYQVMEQFRTTAAYQRAPDVFNQRMWTLLEVIVPPVERPVGDGLGLDDLRAQVFEQANNAQQTCGDGIITLIDQFETTVLAWQAASSVPEGGISMIQPLRDLGWQLLAASMTDEYGAAIARARTGRRNWLQGNGPEVLRHPLDDLSDAELAADPLEPDEVEIRLRLRELVQPKLGLLPQPVRLFAEKISNATATKVAREVKVLTGQRLPEWLVAQPFWQRYWKRVAPEAFEAVQAHWDDVSNVFEDVIDRPKPFDLSGKRLEAAIDQLSQFTSATEPTPIPWRDSAGKPQQVQLSEGVRWQIFTWYKLELEKAITAVVREKTLEQFRLNPS